MRTIIRNWKTAFPVLLIASILCVMLTSESIHCGGDEYMEAIRAEMNAHAKASRRYEGRIMCSIEHMTHNRVIDPPLVSSVITNESAWKIRAFSSAAARGLMQLMKSGFEQASWANGIKYLEVVKNTNGEIVRYKKGKKKGQPKKKVIIRQAYNIRNNISAGVEMLSWLYERYPYLYDDGSIDEINFEKVIEIYNVGWGRYHDKGIRNAEYVKNVSRTYARHRRMFYNTYGTREGFTAYCNNTYRKISRRRR